MAADAAAKRRGGIAVGLTHGLFASDAPFGLFFPDPQRVHQALQRFDDGHEGQCSIAVPSRLASRAVCRGVIIVGGMGAIGDDVIVNIEARVRFLFAPGAGAPSTSAWMQAWTARLGRIGDVATMDYPYMLQGKRRPDRQPTLVAAHREALATLRANASRPAAGPAVDGPVFLIGKSMGSRMGCHLTVELQGAPPSPVAGVICLGYPLVSGSSGAMRDQVLLAPAGTRESVVLRL